MLVLLLLACSGPDSKSSSDSESAAGDTQATSTSSTTCATMNSGTDWAWDGECPRMVTPCDIVVEGCAFSIDYEADGGMTMGMPYSGTLSGTAVSFADDDRVDGCVGTLLDADHIEGSCADGCSFTLER